MNGGVFHPFDVLSQDEMEEGLRAYRYYGLDAVADLFIRARSMIETGLELGSFEKEVDEEYSVHVPDDQTLEQIFQRHLQLILSLMPRCEPLPECADCCC